MNPIPEQLWSKLCKQAQDELLAVLATFNVQTKSEMQSEAFGATKMADFRQYNQKQLKAYIHMVILRLERELDAAQNGIKEPRPIRRKDNLE